MKRAIQRVVVAGTVVVFLVGANRLAAQDKRLTRSAAAPVSSQYGVPTPPGLEPYDHSAVPPSSYGWDDALPADCGFGCPPSWRTRVEVLMMNREGESGVSLSNGFRLNDFDYTEGGRITLNRKYDCALGWEVVYTGLFEFEEDGALAAAGTLNTSLSPADVNLSAFNGANLHQQLYRSTLQSIEASQKWWGWDVLTTTAGIRYINVDEDFAFRSVDAGGDIGQFSIETTNHLVGAQLGVDMLYPIGQWSFDLMLKGGLFANVAESNTFLRNAGTVQFSNSSEDVAFAAMIEYGTYLRYALTPRVTVRAGYELLWLYGAGLAIEQVSNPISTATGNSFDGEGDIFYHGGTLGVEVIW